MTNAIARPSSNGYTGQATQIEQARATTEVLAAVEAAKKWPRDEDACEEKMKRACARPLVADKAFWAFPRGGEQLTGSTIHLATTLAGIWGNMQYGVVELERNIVRRESTMLAVAWELETNTRATTTFLVPHVRDTKRGQRDLTDLRDVYENNANQGARRVREMLFKILPDWYTETGEDICRATLEKSDKPIADQRAAILTAFESLGVTAEQLTAKVGREWDQTTPGDLAILRIVGKSVRRGETTVAEQFPVRDAAPQATAVTAAELTGAPPTTEVDPDVKKRERRMFALLRDAGVEKDRDRRLALLGLILRTEVTTSSDLSHEDRGTVIDELERWKAGPKAHAGETLAEMVAARLSEAAEEAAELATLDAQREAAETASADSAGAGQ